MVSKHRQTDWSGRVATLNTLSSDRDDKLNGPSSKTRTPVSVSDESHYSEYTAETQQSSDESDDESITSVVESFDDLGLGKACLALLSVTQVIENLSHTVRTLGSNLTLTREANADWQLRYRDLEEENATLRSQIAAQQKAISALTTNSQHSTCPGSSYPSGTEDRPSNPRDGEPNFGPLSTEKPKCSKKPDEPRRKLFSHFLKRNTTPVDGEKKSGKSRWRTSRYWPRKPRRPSKANPQRVRVAVGDKQPRLVQ
ncbi:hypothetical protein QFC21_003293 [Naganishia friedmannii]|uniref:Uncharacterized protein n=1 Tax=Naganishia friedmannii TaxID=89922 RepID=A0ACC2VPU6_9TREE|nr:hypothetical protein QFC21_003293 [Naganishia friedmannii]